jgi:hypothetical protein
MLSRSKWIANRRPGMVVAYWKQIFLSSWTWIWDLLFNSLLLPDHLHNLNLTDFFLAKCHTFYSWS